MRNQINSLCPSWLQEHPSRAQPCSSPAPAQPPFPSPYRSHGSPPPSFSQCFPLPSQPCLPLGWFSEASCSGSLASPPLPSSFFPLVPSYPFLATGISFASSPDICLGHLYRELPTPRREQEGPGPLPVCLSVVGLRPDPLQGPPPPSWTIGLWEGDRVLTAAHSCLALGLRLPARSP